MDVIVVGGGMCGLATAMLLARDGLSVTVVESDPQEPPDDIDAVWEAWDRRGVAQFRQPHLALPRLRQLLESQLPDVLEAMRAAGGKELNLVDMLPEGISDRDPRPDDDRFGTVTARRPVLEKAFADAAAREPGVDIRRGVKVAGLLIGAAVIDGTPNVVGVLTDSGEELRADLVVDAMGRRSKTSEWIQAAGARPPVEESVDLGFSYYTRFFRSRDGSTPEIRARLNSPYETFSVLTLPSDNNTWTVAVTTLSGDMPLKNLRHKEAWTRVVAACPLQEHWLDGEPLTDVLAMSGVLDRARKFVIDGVPVATGLLPVADAWACTNPNMGRGISLGVWHAVVLRDTVQKYADDPEELAVVFDALTQTKMNPWYAAQVEMDRLRTAEIEAQRAGLPFDDNRPKLARAFGVAATLDPDVFRGLLDVISCLATPKQVMSRPGMADKALAAAEGQQAALPPGPTREELLKLVA